MRSSPRTAEMTAISSYRCPERMHSSPRPGLLGESSAMPPVRTAATTCPDRCSQLNGILTNRGKAYVGRNRRSGNACTFVAKCNWSRHQNGDATTHRALKDIWPEREADSSSTSLRNQWAPERIGKFHCSGRESLLPVSRRHVVII